MFSYRIPFHLNSILEHPKCACIYAIKNGCFGGVYIGSTIDFRKRINMHESRLMANVHHSYIMQNEWNKDNSEFRVSIIEIIGNTEDLLKREQYWIDKLNPKYNICRIAGNSIGCRRTEQTRQKIKDAVTGVKHPDWRRKQKSLSQSGDNHWTKKKRFSEESKQRMSEAQKKLYQSGYKHPGARPVVGVSTIDGSLIFFESMERAAIEKYFPGYIRKSMKAGVPYKSFMWEYYDETSFNVQNTD